MKKFLIGLLCGLLLSGLALIVTVFSMLRFGERRPTVPAGATLMLRLEGSIPEKAPVEFPLPWLESMRPTTIQETWDLLRKAEADQRVRAVLFQPERVQAGWGRLQEIRENLLKFRRSGKPLVAFLRNPGAREYYLATAADRIVMTAEDVLDLKGLRAELIFLRQTLDKLGVEFEVEHAGKYKDAMDMFTRTSMTKETREVVDTILDHLQDHLVETIAASRGRTPAQVLASLNQGPFLAGQAREHGLVDALLFEDEVHQELAKRLGQSQLRRLSWRDYLRVPAGSLGLEGRSRIALVIGEGTILRGEMADGLGGDSGLLLSGPFVRLLRQIREDPEIRGVILRIDSPGGDAIASDEILREARLLSRKKPTVISMGDLAASGGYYIAMTGDPIIAYDSTFTGSIGVIYGKVNLRGLYDKLGVRKEILTRGRFADIDSDYTPLTEAGRRKLREGIDQVYESFLARVAEGRRRPTGEIEPLAQGRVWLGAQARHNRLIDELGGLDRAIELVKQKAKIPPQEKIRLVTYPPRRSILDQLFGWKVDSVLEARLRSMVDAGDLRLWAQGGIFRLTPYQVRIR